MTKYKTITILFLIIFPSFLHASQDNFKNIKNDEIKNIKVIKNKKIINYPCFNFGNFINNNLIDKNYKIEIIRFKSGKYKKRNKKLKNINTSDFVIHGKVVTYSKSNYSKRIEKIEHYEYGVLNGQTEIYKKEKLIEVINFKNGKLSGYNIKYNKKGIIISKEYYKNDILIHKII